MMRKIVKENSGMGKKYRHWQPLAEGVPRDFAALRHMLHSNRNFAPVASLQYGDHGLAAALDTVRRALHTHKKIALYADYDVDGTMSCTSWIWFLRAIGYHNFMHYIPCRFKEGYGVNLAAIKHLVQDCGAQLIITMDTGITANVEAAWCAEQGVEFICTDHHLVQAEKMPNCVILNPKQHPDSMYQELCGAGITFVLLRALARHFPVPQALWTDLLALTGMATICDLVPLNAVNHKLAKMGIQALTRSQRPILRALLSACRSTYDLDESDVGFRLGPRINAVGRLDHADAVIKAFSEEDPTVLIAHMDSCNAERKEIQRAIVKHAQRTAAKQQGAPLLFIGGDFHPGVLGIAAGRIAEDFWCPTFLFNDRDPLCKGSARAIAGFDVTAAMHSARQLLTKFGGHRAAGGFSFARAQRTALHAALLAYAEEQRTAQPALWESRIDFDCQLPKELCTLRLLDQLADMKPFGMGFAEPKFVVQGEIIATQFYRDRNTGEPAHTAVNIRGHNARSTKVIFFHEVHTELQQATDASFVVTASANKFRNVPTLDFIGRDFSLG